MTRKSLITASVSAILMTSLVISGCQFFYPKKIHITDIRMARGVSENFMPIEPAESFSNKTSQVFCWFKWEKAEVNLQITAKWYYTSENINILNYQLTIPRREGAGSVLLSMPEGKTLPSGSYRVDLVSDNHILKSCEFRIE